MNALSFHELSRRADRREREGLGAIYTPGWLADLIVHETLARVADPEQATVCDPTCGAGSLLLAARSAGIAPDRLYGVDRDPEAVALARAGIPEARLAVGEALVGLDWSGAFPGTGGTFDVLVGNPPFVRIQHLRAHDPGLADALATRYGSAAGSFDLYGPLLELALDRMRQAAGFVLPHRFFKTEYGRHLRERLAPHVAAIVDYGDRTVFDDAQTYVCVLVLERRRRTWFAYTRAWDAKGPPVAAEVPTGALTPEVWLPLLPDERRAWEKLQAGGTPLFGTAASPAAKLFVGLQTPSNRVFRLEPVGIRGDTLLVRSGAEPEPFEVERTVTRKLLMGADIRAFSVEDRGRLLLFPYLGKDLLDLPRVAPKATAYLARHLTPGASGRRWWAYRFPKNLGAFEQPKILVGGVAARGRYAFDQQGVYYVVGGGDGGYSLVPRQGVDPWALLGLLSSSPLDYSLQRRSALFSGRCYSYGRRFLHALPIRADALTGRLADLARRRAIGARADFPDLDAAIDDEVGEAYGLDAADWRAIRRLVVPRKI